MSFSEENRSGSATTHPQEKLHVHQHWTAAKTLPRMKDVRKEMPA